MAIVVGLQGGEADRASWCGQRVRILRHTRPIPEWELSSRQGPLWAGRRQAPPLAAAVRGLEVCEAAVGAESRAPQPARPGVYGAAPPRHPADPKPRPEHAQRPGNHVGSPASAGRRKVWREGMGTSGSCWDAGLRLLVTWRPRHPDTYTAEIQKVVHGRWGPGHRDSGD